MTRLDEIVSMAIGNDSELWAWGEDLGRFENGVSDGTIHTVPIKVPVEAIYAVASSPGHVP